MKTNRILALLLVAVLSIGVGTAIWKMSRKGQTPDTPAEQPQKPPEGQKPVETVPDNKTGTDRNTPAATDTGAPEGNSVQEAKVHIRKAKEIMHGLGPMATPMIISFDVEQRTGPAESAIEELQKALEISPDNVEAKALLVHLRARIDYEYYENSADKEDPGVSASYIRKINESIADMTAQIEEHKQDDTLWFVRGTLCLMLVHTPEWERHAAMAERDFEHSIQLYPDRAEAHYYLGVLSKIESDPMPPQEELEKMTKQERIAKYRLLCDFKQHIIDALKIDMDLNICQYALPLNVDSIWHPEYKPREFTSKEVFDRAKKSVVFISTKEGFGTGFVASTNYINPERPEANLGDFALIITNRHVVAGAADGKVSVMTFDRKKYEGKVFMTSDTHDLAAVMVDGAGDWPAIRQQLDPEPGTVEIKDIKYWDEKLEKMKLFEMKPVRAKVYWTGEVSSFMPEWPDVGERVVAIGHPGAANVKGGATPLYWTMTEGSVSNLLKREDFVQTDTAINGGNSGGPLLNLKCQLVGVIKASFKADDTKEMQDTNIAISAKPVAEFASKASMLYTNQLYKEGKSKGYYE